MGSTLLWHLINWRSCWEYVTILWRFGEGGKKQDIHDVNKYGIMMCTAFIRLDLWWPHGEHEPSISSPNCLVLRRPRKTTLDWSSHSVCTLLVWFIYRRKDNVCSNGHTRLFSVLRSRLRAIWGAQIPRERHKHVPLLPRTGILPLSTPLSVLQVEEQIHKCCTWNVDGRKQRPFLSQKFCVTVSSLKHQGNFLLSLYLLYFIINLFYFSSFPCSPSVSFLPPSPLLLSSSYAHIIRFLLLFLSSSIAPSAPSRSYSFLTEDNKRGFSIPMTRTEISLVKR